MANSIFIKLNIILSQNTAEYCANVINTFLMKRHFGQVKSYDEWIHSKIVSNTLKLLDKEILHLKKTK